MFSSGKKLYKDAYKTPVQWDSLGYLDVLKTQKEKNLFKSWRQLLLTYQAEGPIGSWQDAFYQFVATSGYIFGQLCKCLNCVCKYPALLSPTYSFLSVTSQQIHHRFNNKQPDSTIIFTNYSSFYLECECCYFSWNPSALGCLPLFITLMQLNPKPIHLPDSPRSLSSIFSHVSTLRPTYSSQGSLHPLPYPQNGSNEYLPHRIALRIKCINRQDAVKMLGPL